MSNKPRPLGNTARQMLDDADMELAAALVRMRALASNDVMERLERQLVTAQAAQAVTEARRLIAVCKSLGAQ